MNQTLFGIKEAWEKNRRPVFVVVALISVIVLFGCGFYWYHFPSNGFSKDPKNWTEFSIYITAVISFLNLLVFAILSYLIYRYNARNDGEIKYQRILHEKPLIMFSYRVSDNCYSIQNIGRGAAINVEIRTIEKDSEWKGVIWNSMGAKNDIQKMDWTTNTNAICAIYHDSFGLEYVSYMDDNKLRVIHCFDEESVKAYPKEFENSRIVICNRQYLIGQFRIFSFLGPDIFLRCRSKLSYHLLPC